MKRGQLLHLLGFFSHLLLLQAFASSSSSVIAQAQINSNQIENKAEKGEVFPPVYKLTPEQLETYKRDGVLIVRGLIKGKELKNAIRTAKKLNRMSLLNFVVIKVLKFNSYRSVSFQTWRKFKSMEHIAFDSHLPSIVAQLMGYVNYNDGDDDASTTTSRKPIRLLKDAFLSYQEGSKGCGWHVDDKFFWPCEDSPINTPDAGINAWITLSPLKASIGGGLAVAPTSHNASWREEARAVITPPSSKFLTCEMETLSPEFHNKINEFRRTYDMEPGDAIFHDRYTFHRSDPFTKERKMGWWKRTKYRISLRFMPEDATVVPTHTDPAFLEKNMTIGDELRKGEEYFPQVWPSSILKERSRQVKAEEALISWSFLFSLFKKGKK